MFDVLVIACYSFVIIAAFGKLMEGLAAGMKETSRHGPTDTKE